MDSKKFDRLYSDEISLQPDAALEDYIQLNLRKVRSYRRKFDIPVIGIAGAEGKTTTKKMLSAILSPRYKLLETPRNCSTTSGVTSTLLKLDESHQIAVLELGIANPKQFLWAARVAEPNIAVITNIGEAHLASQGDKFLIADAKVELVRGLPENGFAVLNIDDDLVSGIGRFSPSPNVVKFGLNKSAQFFASDIRYLGPQGISFTVNGHYQFHMPIFGSTSIYNALAAISVARILKMDFSDIREGLEKRFSLPDGAGNLIRRDSYNILNYSYDATINSVSKACESLVQFKPFSKKLILVIGDIRDPGPDVVQAHLKTGYYIAALPIDTVITYGKNASLIAEGIKQMNHTRKALEQCHNPQELVAAAGRHLEPDSTVLCIGSRELNMQDRLADIMAEKP